MTSFTEKKIDVTFDLAQGQFEGGGNSATVSGLRVMASITNYGGAEQSVAELSIYGMPLNLMNQLSNVGSKYNKILPNGITVTAGDDEMGMSVVFAGQIYLAFVDGNSQPEVCFRISAMPGYYGRIAPADPTSIKGSGDVAGMMKSIATTLGFGFENTGVNKKLANPYYAGTAFQQANQIARDAGITWFLDKGTMVIMDPANPRAGPTVTLTPQTGMIGYPAFNQNQVIVTSLYNPAVLFGSEIEIKSSLDAANGKFIVQSLTYQLESQMPRGSWFMWITAYIAGETSP